jgi:hypothetical protein
MNSINFDNNSGTKKKPLYINYETTGEEGEERVGERG